MLMRIKYKYQRGAHLISRKWRAIMDNNKKTGRRDLIDEKGRRYKFNCEAFKELVDRERMLNKSQGKP